MAFSKAMTTRPVADDVWGSENPSNACPDASHPDAPPSGLLSASARRGARAAGEREGFSAGEAETTQTGFEAGASPRFGRGGKKG